MPLSTGPWTISHNMTISPKLTAKVQKNRRMGGAISEEELEQICQKIDQLHTLLDMEQPFTFRVQDKQGASLVTFSRRKLFRNF